MIITDKDVEERYIHKKSAVQQRFVSSHTRPRRMDHVVDFDRADLGLEDHGWVGRVNFVDRTVDVHFFGGTVEYNGCDQTCWLNGIRHHISILDEIMEGGGDWQQYDLDDFEGRWDSHEGGDGIWYIGG